MCLLLTALWWSCSMWANFLTGMYLHGELVMEPRQVACYYLRHQFRTDMFMILCDWAGFIATFAELSGDADAFGNFSRVLRLVRLLRFTSFLRVKKLTKKIQDHLLHLTFGRGSGFSESVDFLTSTMTLLAAIVWANHLMGCAWCVV